MNFIKSVDKSKFLCFTLLQTPQMLISSLQYTLFDQSFVKSFFFASALLIDVLHWFACFTEYRVVLHW